MVNGTKHTTRKIPAQTFGFDLFARALHYTNFHGWGTWPYGSQVLQQVAPAVNSEPRSLFTSHKQGDAGSRHRPCPSMAQRIPGNLCSALTSTA